MPRKQNLTAMDQKKTLECLIARKLPGMTMEELRKLYDTADKLLNKRWR